MKELKALIKRDTKLFFKDKGMFFTSLITPVILLVLYATFLANVYKDSFTGAIPDAFPVDEGLIDGCVGGQLFSSLLAVCCVTVAFCSNMLIVQDQKRPDHNSGKKLGSGHGILSFYTDYDADYMLCGHGCVLYLHKSYRLVHDGI